MNVRQANVVSASSGSAEDPFDLVEDAWRDREVAAFGFDREGRFRYANPAFADLVGWNPEPFYGRPPPLPWWEETESDRTRRQLEAWVGGQLVELGVAGVQVLARHRSGRLLELVVSGRTIYDETGMPAALLGVSAEIGASDEPGIPEGLREAAEQLLRTAELVQRSLLAGGGDAGDARLARVPGVSALSTREREVLRRLGEGLRVSTIASDLDIRPATVRNHLKSIYRKTGLHSQARLVSALRFGR